MADGRIVCSREFEETEIIRNIEEAEIGMDTKKKSIRFAAVFFAAAILFAAASKTKAC